MNDWQFFERACKAGMAIGTALIIIGFFTTLWLVLIGFVIGVGSGIVYENR